MSHPVTPADPMDPRPAAGSGSRGPDGRDLAAQQRDRFGGMKFGACFLGWTTAVGITVLITTLVGLVAAFSGVADGVPPTNPSTLPMGDLRTIGTIGVVAVLVAEFFAFLGGGYVAGRMARFKGLRQGLGVWLWSVIATAVVVAIGLTAQGQLSTIRGLPGAVGQLPSATTTTAAAGIGIVLGVSLLGALLGGLAGMSYHRRVDRYVPEAA